MDWDKLKIFHAVAEAGNFIPDILKGEISGRDIVDLNK